NLRHPPRLMSRYYTPVSRERKRIRVSRVTRRSISGRQIIRIATILRCSMQHNRLWHRRCSVWLRHPQERVMTKLEQQNVAVQVPFKTRYANFIGGKWVAPVNGKYFDNVTPVTGRPFCEIPRSDKDDIEAALDAAHAAKKAWGRTSPAERANIMN